MPSSLQPLLHDLVIAVASPSVMLSAADGDIDSATTGAGAQGLFHADHRVLSRARLSVGDQPLDAIAARALGGGGARFTLLARGLDDLRIDRHRELRPGLLVERIVLSSSAGRPDGTIVALAVGGDLVEVLDVMAGRGERRPALPVTAGGDGALAWGRRGVSVRVEGDGATVDPTGGMLSWDVELPAGVAVELEWRVHVVSTTAVTVPPTAALPWAESRLSCDDRRLERLWQRSMADLAGLRTALPGAPEEVFVAAGAPWFLTLFGRDSLWAARMLLPLGTELARGTLVALARHQGVRHDPVSAEAPGKILHELRRTGFDDGSGIALPPVYYGTVDATALWVCLLHDAWRWGMGSREVERLLPAMQAALGWLERAAEQAPHGFVQYVDGSGTGLVNQGWKDSDDAVRFADGRFAEPPIALAEVQGYAHEAALAGASLLEAFGRAGSDRWTAWAARLADRFRDRFWVADAEGAYPAMALDVRGRPVDAMTSNVGHLIGTGLLDAAESALVARRLAAPDMVEGFGLRTMSSRSAAFSPLSYHCGSVWPHDTAIVLGGLARGGHGAVAAELVEGVLAAAEAFEYRLPELWGGDARRDVSAPVPYPAACRPQAWSASAVVALVQTVLGLQPDGDGGRIAVRAMTPSPVGALRVDGLVLGGAIASVGVDAAGRVVTAPV